MRITNLSIIFALLGPSIGLVAQESNSLLVRSDVLESRGETDADIALLEQANRQTPGDSEIEKRLSRQYLRKIEDYSDPISRKKNADLALSLAQDAAEKLPDDSEALVGLAAAYGRILDMVDDKTKIEYSKKVYADVTKGLEFNPSSDFGHLILARWNFEMATLNPLLRGLVEFIYGQLPPASKEHALTEFREAIELAPTKIVHHAEYAKALDQIGDKTEAIKEWKKVTKLKPIDAQDQRYEKMAKNGLISDGQPAR